MTEKNDGGPAFPQAHGTRKQYQPTGIITGEILIQGNPGMSLRDYFAAKAMQGLISACNSEGIWTGCGDKKMNDNMAIIAYMVADAMLKAKEEK